MKTIAILAIIAIAAAANLQTNKNLKYKSFLDFATSYIQTQHNSGMDSVFTDVDGNTTEVEDAEEEELVGISYDQITSTVAGFIEDEIESEVEQAVEAEVESELKELEEEQEDEAENAEEEQDFIEEALAAKEAFETQETMENIDTDEIGEAQQEQAENEEKSEDAIEETLEELEGS